MADAPMTTPTTRAELIALMALGVCYDALCLCAADGRMHTNCIRDASRTLAAIEAAGCRVVPVVATQEMRAAIEWWDIEDCADAQYVLDDLLAEGPYGPPVA